MFRRMRFPKGILIMSAVGTSIGFVVLMKDKIGGDDYEGNEQVTGKTIVVTGANSGMGKSLSMDLAKRGGRILMACRDMEKCEAARKEIMEASFNRNVECKKLDLASLKSVREFAEDIKANEKRLDVLVNNAGVMAPPYEVTEEGFEMQLGVNFLGPFLLTNLLLDKLEASKPSRIINIGSIGYYKAFIQFRDLNSTKFYDKQAAYNQSKLAVMLFNLELSKRLEGTGVKSFLVIPNLTLTDIGRHLSMNKSLSKFIVSPLWWFFMHTPRQGIQTTLQGILTPDLQVERGNYLRMLEEQKPEARGRCEVDSQRLWLVAERWTGLE